jgi:hypothetical protein
MVSTYDTFKLISSYWACAELQYCPVLRFCRTALKSQRRQSSLELFSSQDLGLIISVCSEVTTPISARSVRTIRPGPVILYFVLTLTLNSELRHLQLRLAHPVPLIQYFDAPCVLCHLQLTLYFTTIK